jgi:tungstate transport system substrate-binding protein
MLHMRTRRLLASGLVLVTLCALAGCSTASGDVEPEPSRVVLASTTSTQDSGLFDVLVPSFESSHPQYDIEVVAVGTGEALELGRRKDADVLLVHATTAEEEFVADGYGTERFDVMYNDFVILGPAGDPAGTAESADAAAAFAGIAEAQSPFVSRGDDSGTHKRELAIWREASVSPEGAWYLSVGQGMGDSLRLASEKGAYILSDRATYLATRADLVLEVLFEEDPLLYNQYGVVTVADATNAEGADAFASWITSGEAQGIIGEFGWDEYGRALFTPNSR